MVSLHLGKFIFYIYISNNWCSLFQNIGSKVLDTYKVGPLANWKDNILQIGIEGMGKKLWFSFLGRIFVFGITSTIQGGNFKCLPKLYIYIYIYTT